MGNPNTQQSTGEGTVFVAAPLGEGAGGMAAKTQHLNSLCRARASSVWLAVAEKSHGVAVEIIRLLKFHRVSTPPLLEFLRRASEQK